MPHCAILGNSLAAGVATFRPNCLTDTQIGITSTRYTATHLMAVTVEVTLISLGVNDGPPTPSTAENLIHLRVGIQSRQVYWLLPARPEATRSLIKEIAHAFNDRLIETRGFTGPDGIHLPASTYHAIASVLDLSAPP